MAFFMDQATIFHGSSHHYPIARWVSCSARPAWPSTSPSRRSTAGPRQRWSLGWFSSRWFHGEISWGFSLGDIMRRGHQHLVTLGIPSDVSSNLENPPFRNSVCQFSHENTKKKREYRGFFSLPRLPEGTPGPYTSHEEHGFLMGTLWEWGNKNHWGYPQRIPAADCNTMIVMM